MITTVSENIIKPYKLNSLAALFSSIMFIAFVSYAPNSNADEKKEGKSIGHYIVYNDGTVYDKKTSLTWMTCSLGQTYTRNTCIGESKRFSWQDAMDTAKKTTHAGKSDWRLPSVDELHSLVYCSSGKQSRGRVNVNRSNVIGLVSGPDYPHGACKGDFQRPTIFSDVFPNTPSRFYWSSSPFIHPLFSSSAWGVHFNSGYDYSNSHRHRFRVRLVRSEQ